MEKEKEIKKKKPEKVEYFTEDMGREIYPFQPALSTRSQSSKPITNTLSLRRMKK